MTQKYFLVAICLASLAACARSEGAEGEEADGRRLDAPTGDGSSGGDGTAAPDARGADAPQGMVAPIQSVRDGTVANDTVVTLEPATPWRAGTTVHVEVTGRDKAGNSLSPTALTFHTALPPDTLAPSVVDVTPAGAAVPTNALLSITFTEAMDPAATEAAIAVAPAIPCTFAWSERTLTCTPTAPLAVTTAYTVTVGTSARDLAGNPLALPVSATFTTAEAADTTPPGMTNSTPGSGASGVLRATTIEVGFSDPKDRAATESAFTVGINGGSLTHLAGSFTWSGSTMVFRPAAPFAHGDAVRWRVADSATDEAGNVLPAPASGMFQVIRQGTAIVVSSAALDGYVRADQTYASDVSYINVGDRSDGLAVYGYVSFNSSMIPAGATVTRATLTVYQQSVTNDPYGSTGLGTLRAERVSYGASLGGSDFGVAAVPAATINLSSDAAIEPKAAELSSIAASCAGAPTCQFRLRFVRPTESPASNGRYDYVSLSAAEHPTSSQRPTLRLTWEYP